MSSLVDEDGSAVQTLDTAADVPRFQHPRDARHTEGRAPPAIMTDQTEDPDATGRRTPPRCATMGPRTPPRKRQLVTCLTHSPPVAPTVMPDSGSYTDGEETFEGVTNDLIDASVRLSPPQQITAGRHIPFEAARWHLPRQGPRCRRPGRPRPETGALT